MMCRSNCDGCHVGPPPDGGKIEMCFLQTIFLNRNGFSLNKSEKDLDFSVLNVYITNGPCIKGTKGAIRGTARADRMIG